MTATEPSGYHGHSIVFRASLTGAFVRHAREKVKKAEWDVSPRNDVVDIFVSCFFHMMAFLWSSTP